MTNPKTVAYCSPIKKMVPFLFFFLLTIFPHSILSTPNPPRNFGFLQNLEGCQKGQTVKGLNELKQYLKKFGYINHNNNNLKPTEDDHDERANVDDDVFDELLESAIKTYQLHYRLKPTGKLDAPTVKQMMMPRCGVPDIINGTTSMPSGKKKHHHHGQNSFFHTVEHYKFTPGNLRWPIPSKAQLTYRFSSSAIPTPNVDMETLRSVCSRAFATWSAVTQFKFTEVAGDQSDIVIGFERGDHGDGYSFDGPGKILAHAFPPQDGRFHYDADENWSDNPGPDMFDLESLALHEIGHLLGLDHSSDPSAVMVSGIAPGSRKRQLSQDDIQGIRALYGL